MPKNSLYARGWTVFTAAYGAALFVTASVAGAQAQLQSAAPCAECIVLAALPEQTSVIAGDLHGLEVLVRLGQDGSLVRDAQERIRDRGGRPGLWISGLDPAAANPQVAALASRAVVDLTAATETSAALAFTAKTYLTELRAAGSSLQVGIYARPAMLEDLWRHGLSPYVDFVAREPVVLPPYPVGRTSGTVAIATMNSEQRSDDLAALTEDRWIVPLPEAEEAARRLVLDVAGAAPLLKEGLIPGGMVDVRCGSRTVPTFLHPESLDTVAVVNRCESEEVTVSTGAAPFTRLTLSTGDTVVSVPAPEGRFAEGVDVRGARTLLVREIVARHQAAAARQRRRVTQLISTGRLTLTFEAAGFPAPMTIGTETVIYTERDLVDIEQRDVRVNGIAFPGHKMPRLPLLEPERAAAVPLAIALTDVYRYSLDGEEVVSGARCYVVRFEPVDRGRSLFAGRAWISADDFALVRVSAVQTGLRGPIVSSEQSDDFRREGDSVWLLARSDVHQIYEGAGHRTPIHRRLTIERHEINPPAFTARRQAAYASPSLMLRDTSAGYRYLDRERSSEPGAPPVVTARGAAERVRTIAAGVIVDPNISRPLPFAGLSYVDFNLLGTGAQMNGFFGGTFGQLAVAVPSLAGTRWQLAARAFGIASSFNDRAFVDGREDYQSNIAQRPAHASVWVLRPVTARVSARAGYEFDYTGYDRADSTAPGFVVPATQLAHGLRLGLDGQWSGWSSSVWWVGSRRAGWRAWGSGPGEYDPRHHAYQRFGAGVTRAFTTSPRLVWRVEAVLMGGKDLDRFSRYAFGSFDNRLRGYPSALIRYDRGGVVRGAAAWTAARHLRLDGFVDVARVRDPGFGDRSRTYPGIGGALEIPAPFGTLAAIEWGYGIQGIDSDGRRGTQVIRVTGYKMF